MKLNNLKPAAGSTHSRRRIGRGPGSGPRLVLVIRERLVSKVVRCHCSVVFQRLVSRISTIRSTSQLIFQLFRLLLKLRILLRLVSRSLRLLALPMVRSLLRFSVTVSLKQNWKLKLMLSQRLLKRLSRQLVVTQL